MIEATCQNCGAIFRTKSSPSRVATGRGKYCSRSCAVSATHRGLPKPKSAAQARILSERNRGKKPWNAKPPVELICAFCGKPFTVKPFEANVRQCCSRACAHGVKRTIRGEDHPLYKPKTEMHCEWCGKARLVKPALVSRFRFCSRRCTGAWVNSQWPRTSSIELALRTELTARGIAFQPEYRIGPYLVDLAIPEARLAIEADGTYWHGTPKQQAKDKRKDEYVTRHGWTMIRLAEDKIRTDVKACGDIIERRLQWSQALLVPPSIDGHSR